MFVSREIIKSAIWMEYVACQFPWFFRNLLHYNLNTIVGFKYYNHPSLSSFRSYTGWGLHRYFWNFSVSIYFVQGCWTRTQKNSTCTRPSLREIWKALSLSLSLSVSEKKARRGRARDPVLRDPPTPRTSPRSLFADRDSPPSPSPLLWYSEMKGGH